jgi:hypothetical protein
MQQHLELRLDSESPHDRHAAVQAILKARNVSHDQIRAIADKYISTGTRAGTVKDVMIVLGRLRAVDQIPWLVDHLTFEAFYKDLKRFQTTEDLYPAVRALIEMGPKAIDPVLQRLATDAAPATQVAGAAVLRGVLGRAEAAERLKSAIAATSDPTARANLSAVAAQLSKS